MKDFSVAVLGPGAVGGFLAALLWRRDVPVACIATEATAAILAARGIRVESASLGSFRTHPRVISQLDYTPDIIFITTKATALPAALGRVDTRFTGKTTVVPLLNGLEHLPVLRDYFGEGVVAATIGNVELKKLSPDYIIHTTPSACIKIASDGGAGVDRLREIAGLLSGAGITVERLASEAEVLWTKLVRLNALACTTSASNLPVGQLRADPEWRRQLEGCLREAAAVALAEGVTIVPESEMATIDALPAGLSTSMNRDITAGKPSELDAIAGAVVRAGLRHGLSCPTIAGLISRIQACTGGP